MAFSTTGVRGGRASVWSDLSSSGSVVRDHTSSSMFSHSDWRGRGVVGSSSRSVGVSAEGVRWSRLGRTGSPTRVPAHDYRPSPTYRKGLGYAWDVNGPETGPPTLPLTIRRTTGTVSLSPGPGVDVPRSNSGLWVWAPSLRVV